ncbi:hypothetical protein KY284_033209 [Solanum tuberosum]|nr:hypothetical protein KY284_033209 [Solanum tuberosum]
MIDEAEIVFNYGGSWVISPMLVYTKKLVHSWLNFDPELLSHKDICDEFTSKLGLSRVKQLLVTRPSEKYYIVDGDDGIRAILSLLCEKFKVVNFFVVQEGELTVFAQNITQYSESCFVDVEVGTDCEHSVGPDYEWDLSEGEECDYEWMEAISKERGRVVGDRLENFKELQVGMTFKDMKEGRQVLNYYTLANKRALTIIKGDTKRTRYGCDVRCPFRCLILRDGKTERFKIKTFINKHTCEEAFFNARADAVTLAQYFKNKLQNNPKYKVKDMRGELENDLKLNVCQSKLKRAKSMALEKLEGSFIDDYNKIEAYAQELKQSNPKSDVLINISKDALAEGKRNFLRMTRFYEQFLSTSMGNSGQRNKQDTVPGLIDIVDKVLPEAQHRYCVRHIESNWCKRWRSGQMRKLMWWWYSNEAYMLTYKNKMQPVRGRKFWKVNPSSATLPPDIVKQLVRPKMKRNREPDEARKRKSEWSQSRKGTQMTCNNCGESNHNVRSCYKEKCTENNTHSKKGKR